MKTLIPLVLFCASSFLTIQAQHRGEAGTTYDLNGPVRSLRTETATSEEKDGQTIERPRVLKMTAEFDEAGNRIDYGMYDGNGVLVVRIVTKFSGRTRESVTYDGAGNVMSSGTSDYDRAGQATGTATYNSDKSLQSKWVHTRDKKGQVIESTQYGANGVILDKTTNTYTPSGGLNTIEREIRYPNGVLKSKEFQNIPDHQFEIVLYKPDGSFWSKTVRVGEQLNEYAEDGSLKRTTPIYFPGGAPEPVNSEANDIRTRVGLSTDQIDSHGNWTKRTSWVMLPTGTKLMKVVYRTITYYEK